MGRSTGWLCVVGWLALAGSGRAEPLTVGVAAPLSGSAAPLGAQISAGARAAAAVLGPAVVQLQVEDDACTAEGGTAAAKRLVAAGARAVVGFLCADALAAAMPAFKAAGIPVITVGVRANSVTDEREKTGWPVVRLGPRADAERDAAARIVPALWREKLFAIVDDGTIYGRELAESVRNAAEAESLKPVFIDTFRPGSESQVGLVGRLRRAGATHAFAGGDRDDIAQMARDAERLDAATVFAGGETLRAEPGPVGLAAGTLMIGLPEWADEAEPAAVAAVRGQGGEPEGYALPAYAAVETAVKALAGAAPGADPADLMPGRSFGTAIGPVAFDGKGDLAENPYRLFRFDGTRFVPQEAP